MEYMTNKKGRPKKYKEIEKLTFTSFQQDITMFKDSLSDYITEENEEYEISQLNRDTVQKFLNLEQWEQNIFIVYLLNKDKRIKNGNSFTFKALAEMLQVERGELMRALKEIKQKLV